MLFSVEQVFVGRDEKQASLKMPAWEARQGYFFCLSSATFPLQHGSFVPHEWLAVKCLLL